jgi:Leucine-rich repeat (LRR) protein
VSEKGLAHLQSCNLTELNLSCCNIRAAALEPIGKIKSLSSLNLSCCSEIESSGLHHLPRLSKLSQLNLAFCSKACKNADDFKQLANITSLVDLNVWACAIDDDKARHLACLENLKRLSLGYNTITSNAIKSISKLKSLEDIDLRGCSKVDETGFKALYLVPHVKKSDESKKKKKKNKYGDSEDED